MIKPGWARTLLVAAAFLGAARPAPGQRINLGTVAPEGSPWHQILQQMGQEWRKISGGSINLVIYSGVFGDEGEMVRKVRVGQLQAVGLSGAGLIHVAPGVSCLQIPMMIESYEEFDYVRQRMTPRLEPLIEQGGFQILNWSEVGWVHFFTKKPARTLDDIRKMKLFTSTGDPEAEKLYKEFRLQVVPLAVTDMLLSLRTGMIDAFHTPPLFAMLDQSFGVAKNMTPVNFAPLAAATLISKRAWERIPEPMRPKLLEAAQTAAQRRREEIRKMAVEAVAEMQKRGLNVVALDAATIANWRTEAEATYPQIRGRLVPVDLFDKVKSLCQEFRLLQQAHKAENPEEQLRIYTRVLELDPSHEGALAGRKEARAKIEKIKKTQKGAGGF